MFLDSLTQKELEKLSSFIGCGVMPVTAARKLFPNKPKRYVAVTKLVRQYCWNKYCAYEHFDERQKYIEISSKIWCDLPVWGQSISDYILKDIGVI